MMLQFAIVNIAAVAVVVDDAVAVVYAVADFNVNAVAVSKDAELRL